MADDSSSSPAPAPAPAVSTMAGMINYLTVSLYQEQFRYKDEQAWARLNEMYDRISKTPSVAPSVSDIREFYNIINSLWRVIDTDDPDYDMYMLQFRRHIGSSVTDEATEEERTYQQERVRHKHESSSSSSSLSSSVQQEPEWDDDTDWLAKEREDWTESIRAKKRGI
jgi:hypothetical protein